MSNNNKTIEALLIEKRKFSPDKKFKKSANIKDKNIYKKAAKNPEKFWEGFANELFWFRKWNKVLQWKPPYSKWFTNAKTNLCYNCLDRHLDTYRKNKAAIIWEAEDGESRTITYWELFKEVSKFANVLKSLGVRKGDRITIYMPMIPELAIAMLACARIGAPHSIVFGGFSAESLSDRINDCNAKILITSDGSFRRGKIIDLKKNADRALKKCPTIEKNIVVKRTNNKVTMKRGRDVWWHKLMENMDSNCPPEKMSSEDMLFILYTSGTTGKPKGIVHTTGGYMVGTYATTKWVFDMKEEDTYWCTADIGWITGHSYIIYGPLANGATTLMYEGSPDYPDIGRFWSIVEKHRVSIFYTAPTAIRTFMKWGDEYPKKYDLTSLRLLGSVGEPINPEAWIWYHLNIGNSNCPIVDTWWQTETGSILITPLPGITKTKPGSATIPFPGIVADVVDEKGKTIKEGAGYLVIKTPWPSMLRTIYGDGKRYKDQYWSKYKNVYFTGDGAKRDKDGYIWVVGRVDDVMNVSGHRLSTMEIESALVDHKDVVEAAVIGRSDELKGQAVVAFTTLKKGINGSKGLVDEIKKHVTKKIGAIARPEEIIFTAELPKTRSGKIMRRLLRDISEGRILGDTTTLADPNVVNQLQSKYEHKEG
ncbi:MAG: acetate--CoA ligase [Candidatus Dadabacteria bacterium]|nr:acetate--CoA ligase [Candidatus Dadabacteria bacterium]NIQ13464.1 acetate--CoA ligase [Candidatus Dadabacteria bacterium]